MVMAEEIKKPKKPIDPNSAKFKLGKIAGDAFASAIEPKAKVKLIVRFTLIPIN